ncbi:MAG: ABC transporter substrate-binding protein [Oscillospiraceae bacterium]
MKRSAKILALLLALAMCFGMLASCGKKTADNPVNTDASQTQSGTDTPAEPKTLVIGTQNFDGKFSPFFYTNAYENDVLSLVHVGLLGADREGAMVLKGIEGETRPYNGTDYLYTGIADCEVTENADGTVYYDITLKDGVQFSDGTTMDIDDVIFSLYVPLDPTYDGIMTLYSLPIEGLDAYRSGMESRINLIVAAGPDGYVANDYYTEDQYNTFWAAFWAAGEKFAQEIVDYCIAAGYGDDVDDVCYEAGAWGYELPEGATAADFFQAIVDVCGFDLSDDGINYESAGTSISNFIADELGDKAGEFQAGVQTGESAPNVSGIQKTGDMSMRLVLTEVNANAIYQLGTTVVPMHYYGDESLYDYDNNMFGFPKGDLSIVKSVTTQPVGAGPYTFESYENGVVTLKANPLYWKGEPKTMYIQFKEGQDQDKIPGVVAGTIDITDPSYSKENAEQIAKANGGEITGDVITTNMVANLGYGYVGFCAKNVCVGNDSGSEASKNLRKAIATVISVYRDVAVDSYYGEFANVINYPISDTSWAAPRVTDEGYKVAFSVDVNGDPIYTEGMTPEEKYEAAKTAALGFFEAAGYTVTDGKVTAAPEGAKMNYEVMIGGGGTGDHPTFMALTLADAALDEIGFDLIVTDMSNFAEMSNAVNAGTAEMFAMAWQATADPDMYQIYHSQGGSNERAYWIKDAELDELIMMARQSTDQTYRKTLYKECLDIVADWAVEIPVYQRQNCIIFSTERVNMDTVTPDITTFWGWANDIELLEMN